MRRPLLRAAAAPVAAQHVAAVLGAVRHLGPRACAVEHRGDETGDGLAQHGDAQAAALLRTARRRRHRLHVAAKVEVRVVVVEARVRRRPGAASSEARPFLHRHEAARLRVQVSVAVVQPAAALARATVDAERPEERGARRLVQVD
ncbi:MAG: hypothetical protein CBD47_00285 [Synechococcus sp. TMED187]|nr:MAG: hypothetical protein CBD47_00285 [Synechococcus sp. TMED187]